MICQNLVEHLEKVPENVVMRVQLEKESMRVRAVREELHKFD